MKNVKHIIFFLIFLAAGWVSFLFLKDCAWATTSFNDITAQSISSGRGTIEFRVKLVKDISADPHNHVLLLAVSADRTETYKIEIIQDKLITHRRFAQCVLAAFCCPYDFKVGDWHSLKLTWNHESSKFYVDNREIKKLGLYSSQDIPKMIPCIRLGREDNFEVDHFEASDLTDVSVDPADQQFVKNCVAPNIDQLIEESPQEKTRGVALHHFPDQKSRDIMKAYLALLPEDFAGAIHHVVYVEDARFPKGGEAGIAQPESKSIILKGAYFDRPDTFFHEAAHLYDHKQKINFGVPNEQSEWAAISGASCYYKGAQMQEFAKNFNKTKAEHAFLAPQGGQCASEDLAIWVGAVYDSYLKNKPLPELFDAAGAGYNEKSKRKMDFLLQKGFVSKEMYDKVTAMPNAVPLRQPKSAGPKTI
jgi:hypothetical protein